MHQSGNYIVKEHPFEIRYLATKHLQGKPWPYFLGFVFFYFLYEWVPDLLGVVFPDSYSAIYASSLDPEIMARLPEIPFVAVLYTFVLGGVLILGRSFYLMTVLRNKSIEFSTLMEGMQFYLKATLLNLARTMITGAAAAFMILPGLYFYYVYSQSAYIFADDPTKGVVQCLRESRMMMRGNKLTMFRLDISYAFIVMLGFLPYIMYITSGSGDPGSMASALMSCALSVGFIVPLSFVYMGRTVLYELMKEGGFANFKYVGESVFREAAEEKKRIQNRMK